MQTLRDLTICFDSIPKSEILIDLRNNVTQMLQLTNLRVERLTHEQTTEFACKVVYIASTQDKYVTVKKTYPVYTTLKIISIHSIPATSHQENYPMLTLDIRLSSKSYFSDIITFVNRNLKNYQAFESTK